MGERAGRLFRRALLTTAWLAAGYYFLFGGEYGVLDVRAMEAERDSLAARVDSLRQTADSLERRAAALEASDQAIERAARERYGFIRDGEHLYRFVEVEDEAGTGLDRPGTTP